MLYDYICFPSQKIELNNIYFDTAKIFESDRWINMVHVESECYFHLHPPGVYLCLMIDILKTLKRASVQRKRKTSLPKESSFYVLAEKRIRTLTWIRDGYFKFAKGAVMGGVMYLLTQDFELFEVLVCSWAYSWIVTKLCVLCPRLGYVIV